MHQTLTNLYNNNLFTEKGKNGLDYLYNREISDEVIEDFKLGFAPDSWDYAIEQLAKLGYKSNEFIKAGVVVEKEESKRIYDRFRNRIIFPIWNEQGKVVAFSARTIEENPQGGKYVNSPETSIFKKSNVLYALPLAKKPIREKDFVILCEGQLDVIAMHRAGFKNSVAPQGTAFTEEQANLLKRYTSKISLCFDGDKAGVNAANKAMDILLTNDMEIKVIDLPSGEDPDGIYRKNGKEKIEELVNNAPDFFDYMINKLTKAIDMSSPYAKNEITQRILAKLSKISNSIVRTTYATNLASYLSIPTPAIFF